MGRVYNCILIINLLACCSADAPVTPKPQVLVMEPLVIEVPAPRFAPLGKHPRDKFLAAIAQIESSGCVDTDHRPIKSGLHGGTRAIGCYGLMPVTVKDIARWSKNAHVKALEDLDPAQISTKLSEDQELAHEVAREYAQRLFFRFDGDRKKMAYAWLYGPNDDEFDEANYYVKRFKQVMVARN